MSKELAVIKTINNMTPLEVFYPKKVDDILKEIKNEADNFEGDASTKKGQEEISSFCYRIRRSKTAIDDLGKGLVEPWKTQAKAVDKERKRVRDTLDAMVKEIMKPVEEAKAKEDTRIANHAKALEHLADFKNLAGDEAAEKILEYNEASMSFYKSRDWEEFAESAGMSQERNYE